MDKDVEWYAITDLELTQFHFAALLAGGGETVKPVVEMIRNRAIDYIEGEETCSPVQQNER